jgi:hypothetical protein
MGGEETDFYMGMLHEYMDVLKAKLTDVQYFWIS